MANFLCSKFFVLWEFRDFLVFFIVIVIVYNNNNKMKQTGVGHKMEIVRLKKFVLKKCGQKDKIFNRLAPRPFVTFCLPPLPSLYVQSSPTAGTIDSIRGSLALFIKSRNIFAHF